RSAAGGIDARQMVVPASGGSQPLVVAEGAVTLEETSSPASHPRIAPVGPPRIQRSTAPAKPVPIAAARGGGGAAAAQAAAAGKAQFDPYRDLPQSTPDLSDQERDRLKRWLRGLLLEALDLPSLRPEELQ